MVNKTKKSSLEKLFFNQKFLSLVGLAVILAVSFPLAKNALQQHRLNREIEDYKKEISALEGKNADLKNWLGYLESDQFAEEQARLNLNLKKPGEELTVIKNLAAASSTGQGLFALPEQKPVAPAGNARKWLNYFFR